MNCETCDYFNYDVLPVCMLRRRYTKEEWTCERHTKDKRRDESRGNEGE